MMERVMEEAQELIPCQQCEIMLVDKEESEDKVMIVRVGIVSMWL